MAGKEALAVRIVIEDKITNLKNIYRMTVCLKCAGVDQIHARFFQAVVFSNGLQNQYHIH